MYKMPFRTYGRNKVVRLYLNCARVWMGAILWRSTTLCYDGHWRIDAARSHWAVARRRPLHRTGRSWWESGASRYVRLGVRRDKINSPTRHSTEEGGLISKASDLYLRTPQFDPQPSHSSILIAVFRWFLQSLEAHVGTVPHLRPRVSTRYQTIMLDAIQGVLHKVEKSFRMLESHFE